MQHKIRVRLSFDVICDYSFSKSITLLSKCRSFICFFASCFPLSLSLSLSLFYFFFYRPVVLPSLCLFRYLLSRIFHKGETVAHFRWKNDSECAPSLFTASPCPRSMHAYIHFILLFERNFNGKFTLKFC
jgi:hypothetical protein